MENLDIKWEFVNNRKKLYRAFLSCKKTFWEEELDPYEWWIEDFETTKNWKNKYPYYCLLWSHNNKIIAWISWNIFNINNLEVAWIWYLWVDKSSSMQLKWIWTFLVKKVEDFILNKSNKLGAIFLESNKDIPELKIKSSIWFWQKQNYRTIDKLDYFSPCVKFDSYSGNAILKDVPLEFMIKIFKEDVFDSNFIKKLISTIYKEWYYQKKEDFDNEIAFEKSNKYIDDKLNKILNTINWEKIVTK